MMMMFLALKMFMAVIRGVVKCLIVSLIAFQTLLKAQSEYDKFEADSAAITLHPKRSFYHPVVNGLPFFITHVTTACLKP